MNYQSSSSNSRAMLPSAFPLQKAVISDPALISSDLDVSSALQVMRSCKTNYVIVISEQKTFLGIFTERDLVQHISQGVPFEGIQLADIIDPNVICIQEHQLSDLLEVLALLRQHHIRHLPILTSQHEVAGIITHESIRELLNPIDLLRLRRVDEVMVRNVICAPPSTSLFHLTQLMAMHQVSCVVIADPNALNQTSPMGIVTEKDIARLWLTSEQNYQSLTAGEVMSAPLLPISAQETLWTAHQLMHSHRIRRLVVINEQGMLDGLVTQTTLLQMLDPVEAHITIETLQDIIHERTTSLHKANVDLHKKILERKRAKAALQKQIARERLLNRIFQKIRQTLNVDEVLTTAVIEIQRFLEVNRAFIYQFSTSDVGKVVTESVDDEYLSVWEDSSFACFLSHLHPEFYQKGRIHSIPDWQKLNLSGDQAQLAEKFQIRSSLVAPIFERDNLWGLLVLNQCHSSRRWEKLEIDLLKQLATQVGLALQQAYLYSQLETANKRLEHLATSDGLTEVANRRRFDEVFQTEWLRMAREQQPLSLILCDVDYFKAFNDTYGHQLGDDCLKQVAQAIQQGATRATDLVARYGGEEFVVILSNTSREGAIRVAQKIQSEILKLAIPHQKSQVNPCVTLSLGIASTIPDFKDQPETLLRSADQALYQAKSEGRNRLIAGNHVSSNHCRSCCVAKTS